MAFDIFRKGEEAAGADSSRIQSTTKETSRMESSGKTTAFLSEDVEFKGTLSFTSNLEINGRFEGEIVADGPLTIGEKAVVKATVVSKSAVVIKGRIQGNIEAKERVEIASTAQVYGDIATPKFTLKEGAIFEGRTSTLGGTKSTADFSNIFTRLGKPERGVSSGPELAKP
jgi:cytoskeletal protein CcmA (bactofilin family)